jgi:molybdopterin biosynthesis enzyme
MNARPMLTVREALDFLLGAARAVSETETVATLEANGRVLASDQRSQLDVPSMDNTQMDGYAVRAAIGSGCRCRSAFRPATLASRCSRAPPPAFLPAR